jgi:F0F1-type ATP synthase delta subunit
MKYPSSIYAKALAEVIADKRITDSDSVVRNVLALVERNGDGAHLGEILADAAKFARRNEGVREVVLESARPMSDAQRKALTALVDARDVVREVIDPGLVAGVRIVVDDERQYDGSLKGKLDKLFGGV